MVSNLRPSKPVVCVIHSDEIAALNDLFKSETPLAHDLLGGVEGLISCIAGSDLTANEHSLDDELAYAELSDTVYSVLENILENRGHYTQEGIIGDVESEFFSWRLNEIIAAASDIYQRLVMDVVIDIMRNKQTMFTSSLHKTKLKNTYYVTFTYEG
jgi:hypothetical protein